MNLENASMEGAADVKVENESCVELDSEIYLYADHVIEEDMVIGPVVLHPEVDMAFLPEDVPVPKENVTHYLLRLPKKPKLETTNEKMDQVKPQKGIKKARINIKKKLSTKIKKNKTHTGKQQHSSSFCKNKSHMKRKSRDFLSHTDVVLSENDVGLEVEMAEDSACLKPVASNLATESTTKNIIDNEFEKSIDNWLDQSDIDSDNEDIEMDGGCFLPTLTPRDALSELASHEDFTPSQICMLQKQDRLNDKAVHELMPDDSLTFDWTEDRKTFTGRRETFTGTPGPTFALTDHMTAVDIFYKMFDTELIDRLVTETNRYAEQKLACLRNQGKLSPNSRLRRWTPTNRDEMITFLTVQILQGLYPRPKESAYFGFNGFGTFQYFGRIFSYTRFMQLKSFLHFVDNQTSTDKTRLNKIRPVLDYFREKFSTLYMPSQDIVVDESLLKWHGRLSFREKIATNAAKESVKTYELCEKSTGYLWKYIVYVGKDKDTETDRPNNGPDNDNEMTYRSLTEGSRPMTNMPPTNATAKIVYDLVEPLLHLGHTIIMDNFYNSPLLLRCLKKHKTDCYGTLRLNRKFVPDSIKTLTKSDLQPGEVVTTYCNDLSLMVWRDARLVSLISTYHQIQMGTQKKNDRLSYKPNLVIDYNRSMGGVDKKDQFVTADSMERRTRVWYKKVFRRLFNTAIFNCFVIFETQHPKISHVQFRRTLAEDLIKIHRQIDLTTEVRLVNNSNQRSQKSPTKRRVYNSLKRPRPIVDGNHFPVRTETKHTRCWICYNRNTEKRNTRTSWKCEECDVPLCIDFCFRAYHKP